jgi:TonB-dependent receptor
MRSVLEFSSRAFGANIQATSGNADLEPLESNNFDIAYENYYAEGSYFAVNYFRKEIDGFLGSATNVGSSYGELTDPLYGEFAAAARADMEANGPRGDTPGWASDQQALWWNAMAQDGNAGICYGGGWVCPPEYMDGLPTDPLALIDFTQPVNSEDGVVDGWEIALQHQFGDSGFGANINATFVGGDVEADIYQLGDQFALPGFGDSANFAAFYEDDKWTATIAYNERGETYAGAEGQDHPIFVEERYQVDVTASYNVNDNLTLFAEARNITDEPVRLYVRHPEMIFLAQDHGPMYKFGLRANF